MKSSLLPLAIAILFLSLPACASPPSKAPTDVRPAAQAACAPAPCATLNAAELNFIGPLLIQRREAAAQEAKSYDAVIQDMQRQIATQEPKPSSVK